MPHDVTVVVPTYNRPGHLARTLNFLRIQPIQLPTIIADGSNSEMAVENAALCKRLGPQFKCFHQPSELDIRGIVANYRARLLTAMRMAQTPFVAFCADDDLLVADVASQSASFLHANPDFVACHGHYVGFRDMPHGMSIDSMSYDGPSIDGTDVAARLLQLYARYEAPYYAVYRRAAQIEIFDELPIVEKEMMIEAHHSAAAVVRGKIKRLDGLYYARNIGVPPHPRVVAGWNQWMAKDFDDFFADYSQHRTRVLDMVHRKSNSGFDAARTKKALDMAFVVYVGREFHMGFWVDEYLDQCIADADERSRIKPWLYEVLLGVARPIETPAKADAGPKADAGRLGKAHVAARAAIRRGVKGAVRVIAGERGVDTARRMRDRVRAMRSLAISPPTELQVPRNSEPQASSGPRVHVVAEVAKRFDAMELQALRANLTRLLADEITS